MGIIGFGVFQARIDGRWVDISSDLDPDVSPLQYWLEAHRPHRGFPADFEVVEGNCHPIADDNIRPPEQRGRNYPSWHFLHGKVMLGEHTHSWLDGTEILAREEAALFDEQQQLLKVRRDDPANVAFADGQLQVMREFFDEVRRLIERFGEIRLIFGITY